MMQTTPKTMAEALDILSREIQAPDDVPSAALSEAAEHVRHLGKIKAWWGRAGNFDDLEVLMQAIP